LHMVRLMLLERLLQHLSQLHNVGGVQAIPYMQVILMLTSDLDGEDEKDKGALDDLLGQLIAELGIHKKLLTEMVLRLPYQIKKIADTNPRILPPVFDHSWFYYLSEQTPFVRRQVRKLLLFICGSKEKYRQLRDLHTLDSHVRSIKKLLEEQGIFLRAGVVTATSGSALQYDTLISLNIKLSSIKVDTRYTTTQQVVKLIGSHTISKVTVKIGDLKRTKMVRTINLYYNNRTVQAIVELKNKYALGNTYYFVLAVTNINTLLDKADRVYHQLMGHRPQLESLLSKVNEAAPEKPQASDDTGAGAGLGASSANVNRYIQQLAQEYSGDCKTSFDELSKIIQKVLASRKELLEYDLQQREAATKSSRSSSSHQPTFTASQYRALSVLGCGHTSSNKCYGCASAVTGHCITLLRALATNPALRQILVLQGLIRELFEYNLRRGTAAMREEVRQLICLLTRCVPLSVKPKLMIDSVNNFFQEIANLLALEEATLSTDLQQGYALKSLTGTESETKAFMAVCIETAKRYNLDDYRTPVFIFERLCSIIYPGRMPGNPYSSNEPGIGPLMRDIKNKICQDCDLVALLEDDTELTLACVSFQVLLKLFSYCVKVKINRQQLVKPEMNTLNVMLGTLNLVLIGTDSITNLHKLEQVSSDEGIGTLAENLLEALREHRDVNLKIEAARRETRAEKKRMAMAMRQKALGTLGMTEQPCEKWVESSYEVEGPHYFTILAMHIMPPERWRSSRVYFLRRLLVAAHARNVSPVSTNKYDKVPTSNTEGGWSFSLAEYVRHNDMPIYEASERVLRAFQDELMPAESVSEFSDVVAPVPPPTPPPPCPLHPRLFLLWSISPPAPQRHTHCPHGYKHFIEHVAALRSLKPFPALPLARGLKPMVEKLRRDRINTSIEQLKSLLGPEFLRQHPDSKQEKADILEMAVSYLRSWQQQKLQLQQQQQQSLLTSGPITAWDGYSRCVQEAVSFLSRCEVQSQAHRLLLSHFQGLQASSRNSPSPCSPSPPSSPLHQVSSSKGMSPASSALWRPW
ncbi:hypothetical protein GOODEAATRI_001011, partial [Goodea atripinnis]